MRSRRLFLATACLVTLIAREARADIYHVKSPSTLTTEKGSELKLPPGYFLDERTWQERDLELKRLQEQEARLKAENKSLRASASSPTWLTVTTSAIGVALAVTAAVILK